MSKKESEIFLGGGNNMSMKSSRLVSTYQTLHLTTTDDGTISMNIKIEADFDSIPEEYQEVFMNMFSAKYLDNVSFGDNPFSLCIPTPKKRWFQLWK